MPGYGLGLSLVAAIAELHGAKVEIEPTERGFSVRTTFETAFPDAASR
jgi:signal transduction histidine kinase